MSASVFKVERKSVTMEVELTTGETGSISMFLPSTKQTQKILLAGEQGASASYANQIELLKTNVYGDLKDAFINDIIENGDINEFVNLVQKEAEKQKKTR